MIMKWETNKWNESWDKSTKGREVWWHGGICPALTTPTHGGDYVDRNKLLYRNSALATAPLRHTSLGSGLISTRCVSTVGRKRRHVILQECPRLASYRQDGTGDPLATVLYGDVNLLRSTADLISRALRDK
jgi:hypothetical protein